MKKQYVNPLTLTPEEDSALGGLTWPAQLLYLRCIRRYVNYSTGVAGSHDIRLSWQRFRDTLEVIRPAKSKKKHEQDRPSRQFIRERTKELISTGLIVVKPNPNNLPFSIFFLPLTSAGQLRLAEEQPLISMFEQPTKESRLMSAKPCSVAPHEQPLTYAPQQPSQHHHNIASNQDNVVDFTGSMPNPPEYLNDFQQPVNAIAEQPVQDSRLLSAKPCAIQAPEQPQIAPDEQPYIYIRKKEIEGRIDLDQKQKERIFLLLKRLVSDTRLHSLDKHFDTFLELAITKELSFDELRDILNKITDDQFSMSLIAHQLKFLRKSQAKPKAKAKPNQVKAPTPKPSTPKAPNNLEAINQMTTELESLNRMIKHAPDNKDLINQRNAIQAKLDQTRQAS